MDPTTVIGGLLFVVGLLTLLTIVPIDNYKSHDPELQKQKMLNWYLSDEELEAPPSAIDWDVFEREVEFQLEKANDPTCKINKSHILQQIDVGATLSHQHRPKTKPLTRANPFGNDAIQVAIDQQIQTLQIPAHQKLEETTWNCPSCNAHIYGFSYCPRCATRPQPTNSPLFCERCGDSVSRASYAEFDKHQSGCGGRIRTVKGLTSSQRALLEMVQAGVMTTNEARHSLEHGLRYLEQKYK